MELSLFDFQGSEPRSTSLRRSRCRARSEGMLTTGRPIFTRSGSSLSSIHSTFFPLEPDSRSPFTFQYHLLRDVLPSRNRNGTSFRHSRTSKPQRQLPIKLEQGCHASADQDHRPFTSAQPCQTSSSGGTSSVSFSTVDERTFELTSICRIFCRADFYRA